MTALLLLLAFGVFSYACHKVWQWLFNPRSKKKFKISEKRLASLEENIAKSKQRERKLKADRFSHALDSIPLVGISSNKRDEYEELIVATNHTDDYGGLYTSSLLHLDWLVISALISMGLGLLAFVFKTTLPLCLVPFTVFTEKYFIGKLYDKKTEISEALYSEFLEFYTMYYVQFIQPDATDTLRGVITSYVPQATLPAREALTRLLYDLDKGEDYALSNFDMRFSDNRHVHKFCSVVRARSKSSPTAFENMESFMGVLQDERDALYDKKLEFRSGLVDKIVKSVVMLNFCIMIIVLLFNM